MREIRTKGQGFHSVLAAYAELRGAEFRDAIVRALPGEVGDAIRYGSLVASGWYPISWYAAVLATAVRLAPDAPNIVREASRVAALHDVRSVYRLVFRMLSTETLIKQAPRLIKLFFDGGEVSVLETRPGFARVRYTELHGFDRNVWLDLLGGTEAFFAVTGAKGLRIRVEEGGGNGDSMMLATVIWS